ncbi:MAG: C1 family peptidase [Candidatus Aquicultorales bacterium]
MKTLSNTHGMGWLPDYPDFRDYTTEHDEIKPVLAKTAAAEKPTLPPATDLREWCSPIEDQESLGSCTAQAGVAVVEYFVKRAHGKDLDASRLFLYKVTRNLAHLEGDTGAFLRTTMGALALFGVPPEEYWPYVIDDFEYEPPAFCYAFAQNYQAIKYFRLDPPGSTGEQILEGIKTNLAAGIPAMFGFTVYTSIDQASETGAIPYPSKGEKIEGGHAIVAVGYDNAKKIKNERDGKETTGALLIRNSWGVGWGDKGYGWLPYEYALTGLAQDWWCLIANEWIDTGEFKV